MIQVIAVITAKPGQRDSILTTFKANVPSVLAEKGCIEYAAAVDSSPALGFQTDYGPDTFVVVEKWASTDALNAHIATPHMQAYASKTIDLIANRTVHILSPT